MIFLYIVVLLFVTVLNGSCDPCHHSRRWSNDGTSLYIPVNYTGVIRIFTSCPKGFKANAAGNLICTNGVTNKPLPKCKKAEAGCPILTIPIHGWMVCNSKTTQVGTICQFRCDEYHYIRGENVRTCQSNYTWSGKTPSCVPMPGCPVLSVPMHGMMMCNSETTQVGTICRFRCYEYHYIRGENVRTCQSNYKWSGETPSCVPLPGCPVLSVPMHGMMMCNSKTTQVGTICRFRCDEYHHIRGENVRTCQSNFKWSGETPSCVPRPESHGNPYVHQTTNWNSHRRTGVDPRSRRSCSVNNGGCDQYCVDSSGTVICSCRSGYRLGRNGKECVDIDECTTNEHHCQHICSNVNGGYACSCEAGYRLIDKYDCADEVPPVFDYCPDSFEVEGDAHEVEVHYSEPEASDNVQIHSIIKNMEPNSTLTPGIHEVTYVAKDSAGNVAECSFNITVSSTAVVECSDLPDPENGKSNCVDWTFGKICEPVCNVNYTLGVNDARIYMCDESETWRPSHVIPPCVPECLYGEAWSSQLQCCEEDILHTT